MTLVDLVRRFPDLRALVIGDVMLDSYYEGVATRLCREGPVPVVRKTATQAAPGGAANTAANLRALGARVTLLGITGHDSHGRHLRSLLADQGIDDTYLVPDDAAQTHHKLRVVANGQYVVRFDEGDTGRCADATRTRLLRGLEHAFGDCDLVVVSDYGYGVASDELLARLRLLRDARHCPLVLDAKQLERHQALRATVVTPSYAEARRALGLPDGDAPVDLDEASRAGAALVDRIGAEQAAITLAGDGVLVVDREGRARHLPAPPVGRANDVGAGDSFTAALALAVAAGADGLTAARVGVEAAAIAVTKACTAVVTRQELLQRVSLRDFARQPRASGRQAWELAAHLESQRRAGRTVVLTNGVFDILHAGHVEFLRRAKTLGDILVVGVNSDRSAARIKGPGRPINREQDRLALVAALDAVDHALLFDEETPAALIRLLRPQIHVKGGDYARQDLPEAEAVREVGGRSVILPLVGDFSTSGMIDRIVAGGAGAVAGGDA